MPASRSFSIISWLVLAGPNVQTIFARRIFLQRPYTADVLLFQKRFHQGLVDGSITLTVRRWEKPHVKPGGRYRVHPIGVVQVDAVSLVRDDELTEADARAAGFESVAELTAWLKPGPQALHRVVLHHAGDGDRVEIATDDHLSEDDVAELQKRLARLDRKSPWTLKTMRLIARHPRVAASKLARKVKRETAPFKVDVRKLKKLGLTMSFEVGYELSPRGRRFLQLSGARASSGAASPTRARPGSGGRRARDL
jgi:hypothetical protein